MRKLLLLLALFGLFPTLSKATISLVQNPTMSQCGFVTSCAITVTSTGSGNFGFFSVATNSGSQNISSISGGGTWTIPGGTTCRRTNGAGSEDCAYITSLTGGVTSITVTMSAKVTHLMIQFLEYSSAGLSFDAGASTASSGANPSVTTITGITGTNDLVIQSLTNGNNATITGPGGNWTNPNDSASDGSQVLGVIGYINCTSSCGTAPSWTMTSQTYMSSGMAFSESAGSTTYPGWEGSWF